MSTTVKELAQKLHIKRNSVEMRMNEIPDFRKKYVTRKGNKLIINDKGGQLICNLHSKPKSGNSTVKKSVNDKVNDSVNDYKIDTLHKMLIQERTHNSQLQKQLDIVNSSNKNLGKLLNQQQQLQLKSQRAVDQLQGKIKHLKEISGHVVTHTNNSENNAQGSEKGESESNNSKHGFWSKLFGKF